MGLKKPLSQIGKIEPCGRIKILKDFFRAPTTPVKRMCLVFIWTNNWTKKKKTLMMDWVTFFFWAQSEISKKKFYVYACFSCNLFFCQKLKGSFPQRLNIDISRYDQLLCYFSPKTRNFLNQFDLKEEIKAIIFDKVRGRREFQQTRKYVIAHSLKLKFNLIVLSSIGQ